MTGILYSIRQPISMKLSEVINPGIADISYLVKLSVQLHLLPVSFFYLFHLRLATKQIVEYFFQLSFHYKKEFQVSINFNIGKDFFVS